jgi:hypothetical protein
MRFEHAILTLQTSSRPPAADRDCRRIAPIRKRARYASRHWDQAQERYMLPSVPLRGELRPVVYASPQFTPRQLLDAALRAEAEGRREAAHQFYWHLNDQYGHTAEAAEGRSGLARLGGGEHRAESPGIGGASAPETAAATGRRAGSGGRPRHVARAKAYRVGRAFAMLLTAVGWLAIGAALSALAVALAPDVQISAVPELKPTPIALLQMTGALLAGAACVLCGQVTRALFDLAGAACEIAALERARGGGDPR